MWLDKNGVWWAARAWLVLNHCVDYGFLFTGVCIFKWFVFEAGALSHWFILVSMSADSNVQDKCLNSETDTHTDDNGDLLLRLFPVNLCLATNSKSTTWPLTPAFPGTLALHDLYKPCVTFSPSLPVTVSILSSWPWL